MFLSHQIDFCDYRQHVPVVKILSCVISAGKEDISVQFSFTLTVKLAPSKHTVFPLQLFCLGPSSIL